MILGAYERKIVSVNEGIRGGPVNSLFQESLYTRDFITDLHVTAISDHQS